MQTHMRRVTFETAIGRCAVTWRDEGIMGFDLPEAKIAPADASAPPEEIARLIERVRRHLAGTAQDFSDVRYDFATISPFNLSVLKATLTVRCGETRSYGEIAHALGQPPGVSRAVGAALGANRWPLLIPCHRIVAANGKMTGFSGPGGIKTKLRLLALEGAQLFSE